PGLSGCRSAGPREPGAFALARPQPGRAPGQAVSPGGRGEVSEGIAPGRPAIPSGALPTGRASRQATPRRRGRPGTQAGRGAQPLLRRALLSAGENLPEAGQQERRGSGLEYVSEAQERTAKGAASLIEQFFSRRLGFSRARTSPPQ